MSCLNVSFILTCYPLLCLDFFVLVVLTYGKLLWTCELSNTFILKNLLPNTIKNSDDLPAGNKSLTYLSCITLNFYKEQTVPTVQHSLHVKIVKDTFT